MAANSVQSCLFISYAAVLFLSGIAYGLTRNRKQNIVNLLLLYLIWSCIGYSFKSIFSGVVTKTNTDNLLICLLIKPVDPYWHLIVLTLYYIVMPLFQRIQLLFQRIQFNRCTIILLLVSIISFEIYHRIQFQDPLTSRYIYRLFYHIAWFFSRTKYQKIYRMGFKFRFLLLMLYPVALLLYLKGIMEANILCGITGTGLAVWCSMILTRRGAIGGLCYIGKYSLYIYLLHNYFTVLYRIVWNTCRLDKVNCIFYVLPNTVIAIVCCLAAKYAIDHIPLLNFTVKPVVIVQQIQERNRS